jgi:hypothetical protein
MLNQPCTVKLAGVSFGNAQANIKTHDVVGLTVKIIVVTPPANAFSGKPAPSRMC